MAEWQLAGLYVFGTVQGVILGWWLWRRPSLKDAPPPTLRAPVLPRQCWCAACDAAQSQFRFRMNLCPKCGDKRCPRAEHHGNECSKPPNHQLRER